MHSSSAFSSARGANAPCRHHHHPHRQPSSNLVAAWRSRLRADERRRPPTPASAAAANAGDANANASPTTEPQPPQHPLVSFVLAHGGAVDGVRPVVAGAAQEQGWGLAADRDLPRGHRCVVLPPKAHLTFEQTSAEAAADASSAAEAQALATLAADIPPELWGARLALALLRERARGGASRFAPYIRALPASFPGVPLFWGQEAVAALDYPPVAEQVKKRCRWLHEFAGRHLGGGGGGGGETDTARAALAGAACDVSGLGWALAAVTSRAFRVGGLDRPAALLPLVDLCNHDFDPNAEVVPYGGGGSGNGGKSNGGSSNAGGGIAVVTKRPLKKGEPVLLSYGPLPNDFLLLDYGFVVDDNPHDAVALRFDAQGLLTAGAAAAGVLREQAGLGGRGGGGGSSSSSSSSSSSPSSTSPPELLDFGEELERSAYKRRRLAALGLLPTGGGGSSPPPSSSSLEVALAAGLPGGAPVADPRLLAATRLLASRHAAETEGLPDRELGAWARSPDASGAAPLGNRANEAAALRTLAGVAGVALSRFGSTLEEDEAALRALEEGGPDADADVEAAQRRRDVALAVRLRAGKKRALLGAIEAFGRRVEALKARRDLRALPADGQGGGDGGKKGKTRGSRPATSRGFGGGV